MVSSDFGTRVEVGRPTTLSADELDWSTPPASGTGGIERYRRLSAETSGYLITADFDSFETTAKARQRFDVLVQDVESLISHHEA